MEYEIVDKKIKIDEKRNINIKLINDHFENAKDKMLNDIDRQMSMFEL